MAKFDVQAALRDGYSQAEIDDFMKKQNAVAVGQADTSGARVLNSLESIPLLGSILSGGIQAARFGGETLAQASRTITDPAFRTATLNPDALTPEQAAHIQKQNKTFLMPEKSIATPEDIIKNGARATAGAMSYAIPGGSTLKGALGAGALMGGLSAASQDDSDIDSIAGGAAGGAAGGGAAYGVAKLLGNLISKAGNSASQAAEGLTLKGIRPSPSQVTNFEKDTGQKMTDVVKKYGFFDRGSDQVDAAITPLQEAFDSIAQSTDKSVNKKDLMMSFAKAIDQYKRAASPELQKKGDDLMTYAANLLSKQGENIPLKDLTTERRVIDKLVKDFKFQPEVAGKNEIIRNILQDAVRQGAGDTKANGQTITEIGKQLQALRALQPIVERQGNLGKGAQAIGLSDLLAGGVGGAVGMAGGPTGSVIGSMGGMAVKKILNSPAAIKAGIKAAGAVSPLLTRAGEGIAQNAGVGIPQKLLGILGGSAGSLVGKDRFENQDSQNSTDSPDNNTHIPGSIPQGPPNATDLVEIYDNVEKKTIQVPRSELPKYGIQDPRAGSAPEQSGITREKIGQAMLMDLIQNGGKNIDKLKVISEYTSPAKEKPPSAATEKIQKLGQSGLRALDEIEQILAQDPYAPLKQAIPGQLGARQYDSAASRAVEGLLRARSGAAVPETEIRRYMNANLPRVGDAPETIKAKLAAFRKDLEAVSNSQGQDDFMSQLNGN